MSDFLALITEVEDLVRLKHLGGKHDQRTHGRSQGGSASGTTLTSAQFADRYKAGITKVDESIASLLPGASVTISGNIGPKGASRIADTVNALPASVRKLMKRIELHEERGSAIEVGSGRFGDTAGDWRAGVVRMFDVNNVSPESADYVMFHESGHAIYDEMQRKSGAEARAAVRSHPEWYTTKGSLKKGIADSDEYAKVAPMDYANRKWKKAWSDGEDGITSYSKAWAAKKAPTETFAEANRIYFETIRQGKGSTSAENAVRRVANASGASRLAEAYISAVRTMSLGESVSAQTKEQSTYELKLLLFDNKWVETTDEMKAAYASELVFDMNGDLVASRTYILR